MRITRGGIDEMKRTDLRVLITKSKATCLCGEKLYGSNLNWYEHSGGLKLEDDKEKQWYYVTCDKCGYDMAIWKIGAELGEAVTDMVKESRQ